MYILQKHRQRLDAKEGVRHATLNPGGSNAVRIFLIPPKMSLYANHPSVLIINGYYILPIGHSWAVLLGFFLEEINRYEGDPMEQKDFDEIIQNAARRCKKIYLSVQLSTLEEDLRQILSVLIDVAAGRKPQMEIGQMSLREYAPHMTAPHRMDLLISSMQKDGRWNCNQKCLHCYAAGQTTAKTEELTTHQWKHIIGKYRSAGIPQLTFTGGEPTMREDLPELVEYANWFVTRLNTNGVNLTPQLCKKLREASLDSVQITVYSRDEATHNKLVGANNFEKTLSGLRNALDAGLDVSVNTPLCTMNRDYAKTLRFLSEMGVTYFSCSGLILTGNAEEEPSARTRLTSEELYDVLKEAAFLCKEKGLDLNFTSPGWLAVQQLTGLGLTPPMCGACLSNMATAPDGSVVPCQSWLDGTVLGNALADPWKKIWNNTQCRKIRNMGEDKSCTCPFLEKAMAKEAGR